MRYIILIICVLSILEASAQNNLKSKPIFIWNFYTEEGEMNNLTNELSETLEEVLIELDFIVLQRRKFSDIQQLIDMENAVLELDDIPNDIMLKIRTTPAKLVLLGNNVSVDFNGNVKLRISIEELETKRIITAKTIIFSEGSAFIYDKRRVVIKDEILELIENNNQNVDPKSKLELANGKIQGEITYFIMEKSTHYYDSNVDKGSVIYVVPYRGIDSLYQTYFSNRNFSLLKSLGDETAIPTEFRDEMITNFNSADTLVWIDFKEIKKESKYRLFCDEYGFFSSEIPPGKYEILIKSNNTYFESLTEGTGMIEYKIIEINANETKNLDHRFKMLVNYNLNPSNYKKR